MDMHQWLRGKTAETVLYMVQGKVDFYKEGRKLDKMLDEQLGERSSEKIQRGTITTLLHNLLMGLWQEHPESLAVTYELRAKDIRRNLKGKEK